MVRRHMDRGLRAAFALWLGTFAVPVVAQERPVAILQDGHGDLDDGLLGSILGDRLVTLSGTTMLVWDLPSRVIVDRFEIPPIALPPDRRGIWWPWRIDFSGPGAVTLFLSPRGEESAVERPLPLSLETHRYGPLGSVQPVDRSAVNDPATDWSIDGTSVFKGPAAEGPPHLSIVSQEPGLLGADVSSRGELIAVLMGDDGTGTKPGELRIIETAGLRVARAEPAESGLNRVTLLDDHRVILWQEKEWYGGQPATAPLLIDKDVRVRPIAHDRRCAATFSSGTLFAFGTRRCTGAGDDDLWRADAGTPGWRRVDLPELKGRHLIGMAGAAKAPRVVLASCPGPLPKSGRLFCARPTLHLYRVDTDRIAASGKLFRPLNPDGGRLQLSDTGVVLQFIEPSPGTAGALGVRMLPPVGDEHLYVVTERPMESGEAGPDTAVLESHLVGDDQLGAGFNATRFAADGASNTIEGQVVGRGGRLPDVGIWWAPIKGGVLRFWRLTDDKPLADLVVRQRGLSVLTPFGTYDTGGRADAAGFRWKFPGEPRSLAPQMFMRDYFEPDLLRRRIDCTLPDNCAKVFRPAPDIARLNRVVPLVEIVGTEPGARPGELVVMLRARGQSEKRPDGSMASSGLHNLRLFRDGRLVAQVQPIPGRLDPFDRAGWRGATEIASPGDDLERSYRLTIPTPANATSVRLQAYAFNTDQVKSDTAELVTPLQQRQAPPRRLFVLTIGIDAYRAGGFPSLRYAGNDARAMARLFRSAQLAGGQLELHEQLLVGTPGMPVTKERVAAAFAKLKAAGPDDVVLISYAGHGYTDKVGRFSLVPADAGLVGDVPDPHGLITAGELAEWLAPVDAAEISFVIDACHSAASFSAGGFKPGPMGDPGLGQLAYDKGIRILAASQPDQYAMEVSSLGHGLLTHAIITEGVEKARADLDGDNRIALDELVRFAAENLEEPRDTVAEAEAMSLIVDYGTDNSKPRQQPALFDFAANSGAPLFFGR